MENALEYASMHMHTQTHTPRKTTFNDGFALKICLFFTRQHASFESKASEQLNFHMIHLVIEFIKCKVNAHRVSIQPFGVIDKMVALIG